MFTPNPVAFTLFGTDVRWYGILIGTGFLIAMFLSYYRAPKFNIDQDFILDFAILLIPLSIVGARAYYVLFSWDNYSGDWAKILNIREGGLAIHGGLITGIAIAAILCLRKKVNFLNLSDLIFPTVALAQAIGRWGNFFNSEAHGGPTDLPWGIIVDGIKVHPTFLYESLWCFLLFILLTILTEHRKFYGQIGLLYGILYSFERFFVEHLRTDSLMIGPFKQAQVLSMCTMLVCLFIYIYLYKKNKKGDLK